MVRVGRNDHELSRVARKYRLALAIALGMSFYAVVAAQVAPAMDTYTIRPAYRVGDRLHYAWHLRSELSWSPEVEGLDWANMTTDFDFVLEANRLTGDGGCLFDLNGGKLQSVAEGPKGKLGIKATPTEASYLLGKKWTKPGANTPLKGSMNITLGPRFEPAGATGVEPIAVFFIAGVDARVWYLVTSAPSNPVSVGSKWSLEFDAAVPGARGEPLHVVVEVEVSGVERVDGDSVLTINYGGTLDLDNSDLKMQNGETIHIVHGRYEARGVVRWHVERGILYSAEVEQTLSATADRPDSRRLDSKALSQIALTRP